MGHYTSTYYKSTYQKDYNWEQDISRSTSPYYTTVVGQGPLPKVRFDPKAY